MIRGLTLYTLTATLALIHVPTAYAQDNEQPSPQEQQKAQESTPYNPMEDLLQKEQEEDSGNGKMNTRTFYHPPEAEKKGKTDKTAGKVSAKEDNASAEDDSKTVAKKDDPEDDIWSRYKKILNTSEKDETNKEDHTASKDGKDSQTDKDGTEDDGKEKQDTAKINKALSDYLHERSHGSHMGMRSFGTPEDHRHPHKTEKRTNLNQ